MRRLMEWCKKAWLMAGITLLMLLALEVVNYFVLRRLEAAAVPPEESYWPRSDSYAGEPWVADYSAEFRRIRARWEPYVYWRRLPFRGQYINISPEGLRDTTPGLAATNGTRPLHVHFFGGSTAWGEGVRDAATIPSFLSSQLAQRQIAAEVVNLAEGGYVSTQDLLMLIRRLQQGDVPDVAIFYQGLNDMYAAAQDGKAGIPHNEWNRREEFNLSSRQIQVYKLALLGPRTGLYTLRVLQRLLAGKANVSDLSIPDHLAKDVVAVYSANVRAIQALAREYGFVPLFYWQPVLYQKPNLTPFEASLKTEQPAQLEPYFAETAEIIRAGNLQANLDGFHDIGEIFADYRGPLYIDFAHISEEGNRLVAERMIQDLDGIIHSR